MFHLTTALDPGAQVPLYEQLYRSLTAELRAGAVPAGTRMPGKRSLAAGTRSPSIRWIQRTRC